MADSRLTFDVLAKDRASSTFKKVGQSADHVGRRFGFLSARTKGLAAGMRVGFGAVATALGGIATISVFKSFISEARESWKVSRLTAAVIKSTGGVAKVTAKQVGNLSMRLSEQAGIDDELVQTGANLLLTFKNVRNEVGKNNQIFDRATAAALNLSAAGFGSVQSASKMLGKALNDPLKGLTALGRAGVTFTEQQKKQIKTLVETGDVLAAQKIILKEVESQVGGAAKAAADPIAKLGVVVNNLKERLGTALLPTISSVADFLSDNLPAAISVVSGAFGDFVAYIRTKVIPPLRNIFDKIDIKAAVRKGKDLFKAARAWGSQVIDGIIAGAKTGDWTDLGKTVAVGLAGALGAAIDLGKMLADLFGKVDWFNVGKAVGQQTGSFALGFISTLLDGIIQAAIHHPIDFAFAILSALGIGAIGGRIASILRKIPFLRIFAPIFEGLHTLTGPLNRAIGRVVSLFGSGFRQGFARHFPGVAKSLRRRLDDLVAGVQLYAEAFFNAGRRLIIGFGRGIGSAIGFVVKQLARIPRAIFKFFTGVDNWLYNAGSRLIGGFINGIRSRIGDVLGTISDIAGKVRDYLPFSPAKKGPLSGRGNPFYSGQSIGELLSKGMVSSKGQVASSAAALAGAARIGAGSSRSGVRGGPVAGSGTGGGITINGPINLYGVQDPQQFIAKLRDFVRVNGRGDVQRALGAA